MRRQPVAFMLIDAAFMADSKWRALGRRLPDPKEFNSALGAWIRVLAAARRNGLADVDAFEEADDGTFLPDLIAVGLLTVAGIPEKPFRAWAPARPKYPSDAAPSVTNVTNTPPDSVSTPFPSHLIVSPTEEGVRGEEPEGDAVTWLAKHGCWVRPGNGYHQNLIRLVEEHGGEAVIGMFDRLARAGVHNGDTKGFIFQASDLLNPRVDMKAIEAEERAEAREKARSNRKVDPMLAEYRKVIQEQYDKEAAERAQ